MWQKIKCYFGFHEYRQAAIKRGRMAKAGGKCVHCHSWSESAKTVELGENDGPDFYVRF